MIPVREVADGVFAPAGGDTIQSTDGKRVAPLSVILHESWTDAQRAEFGVFLAEPAAIPPGRIATSFRFERQGDKVVQLAELASVPLEELKAARTREVEALLQAAFQAGYTPAAGPMAGHTLQVRDAEDRTNWLTSQASYSAAVAAGYGDVVDATFRTSANATAVISYAEGLNVLLAMAAWGRGLMGKSWAVKDWINDPARTRAEIEAMEVADRWAAA